MTEAAPPAAPAAPPRHPRLAPPGLHHTLLAGLRLLCLLRPEAGALRLRPAGQFWLLGLLTVASSLLLQYLDTEPPHWFNADGLKSDATNATLILAACHGLCALAGRTLRSWSLAILLAAALFWLGLVAALLQQLAGSNPQAQWGLFLALLAWWLALVLRACVHVLHDRPPVLRLVGALLLGGLLCGNWLWLDQERYFYTRPPPEPAAAAGYDAPEQPRIEGSAEQVMYAQPDLLDTALARIRPGVPGQPELFVLAFGADGSEQVFRNEVEYVEQLFSQRFGATQRVLKLINSPATVDTLPLATLSNLRRALKGLRSRMDGEDLLFLFLTTHGSEDHQLYVNLAPLALDQIDPASLADALREAEIGPRVVLISACYSGGFLDALDDPRALLITAARHDRPSFGCGSESQITYFGRAFLVDALNQQSDFVEAFELARKLVTRRERAQDEKPSEPQIRVGQAVGAALAAWRATLPETDSGPVPFEPAPLP